MSQDVLDISYRNLLQVGDAPLEVGGARGDTKVYVLGNHYYQGLDGNDNITGGAGNDYLEGGAGADHFLIDLLGIDTLGWFNSDAAVTVKLDPLGGLTPLLGGFAQGGHAQGDTAVGGFENLVGSDFGDKLTGNASANILVGLDGNDLLFGGGGGDSIYGGDGDDQLYGEDGNDTFYFNYGQNQVYGGNGIDTVNYSEGFGVIDMDLALGSGTTSAGSDFYNSIENIVGSNSGDYLRGDAAANNIVGGAGNDDIHSRGGADVLTGGAGKDIYVYASMDDLHQDRITDLSIADKDKVILTGIDGNLTTRDVIEPITFDQINMGYISGGERFTIQITGGNSYYLDINYSISQPQEWQVFVL
jgi:Ca2+-binding RTX toxin-like protein